MRNLKGNEIATATGGIVASALARGAAVYEDAAGMVAATRTLNDFGRRVGEATL